ncbi:MAG: K(+)-transporting ATPase subunit F [Saprospiraceae bacterium]|nr:K(+)-transporting ATPase subunit F [Saprospiraceae bacterium]
MFILFIIAILLFGYMVYVLLRPEKF